jgi:hypothetical protein
MDSDKVVSCVGELLSQPKPRDRSLQGKLNLFCCRNHTVLETSMTPTRQSLDSDLERSTEQSTRQTEDD